MKGENENKQETGGERLGRLERDQGEGERDQRLEIGETNKDQRKRKNKTKQNKRN